MLLCTFPWVYSHTSHPLKHRHPLTLTHTHQDIEKLLWAQTALTTTVGGHAITYIIAGTTQGGQADNLYLFHAPRCPSTPTHPPHCTAHLHVVSLCLYLQLLHLAAPRVVQHGAEGRNRTAANHTTLKGVLPTARVVCSVSRA